MAELYTDNEGNSPIIAPKTVSDLAKMSGLKTTEASESFANFMNKHLSHIEGYEPISPAQAWTLLYTHRVWQGSEERLAEKEALVAGKAEEKARKAEEAAARKAEKEAEKARKAEEKAIRDAAKAAKKAAEGDDLDSVDEEGTDEIKPKRRRRAKPAAEVEETEAVVEGDGEIEGL